MPMRTITIDVQDSNAKGARWRIDIQRSVSEFRETAPACAAELRERFGKLIDQILGVAST